MNSNLKDAFVNRRIIKDPLFYLKNFEEIVSGAALVVTISIIIFNVFMRYSFNKSFNWAEETATIAFAWVVFIGASACYKRNMHIGIDVIVNLVPPGLRKKLDMIMMLFQALLIGVLTYLSIIFSISAWDKPTAVLLISYTWVDISASIGFGLMFFHSIMDLKKKYEKELRR